MPTAENVKQNLGNDDYFESAQENAARANYQGEIATQLIERVREFRVLTSDLVTTLTTSVSGRPRQMWSKDGEVQVSLATVPVAGPTSLESGPCVQWVLNNVAADKLDFQVQLTEEYFVCECSVATRASRVRATSTNDVRRVGTGPGYMVGRAERCAEGAIPWLDHTLRCGNLPVSSSVNQVQLNCQPTQVSFGM